MQDHCDAGSMAQAARALELTQPAISQAIAELESRTGTTLFDRIVRPLALTPAGGVMRQRASALLSEARQIGPLPVAAVAPGRVEAIALPGPKPSRTLTLVSRRQEFGSLPRDLTAACKAALEGEGILLLQKIMPWLGKEFCCSTSSGVARSAGVYRDKRLITHQCCAARATLVII